MESTRRRAPEAKSVVWKHFNSGVDTNGESVLKCNFCSIELLSTTVRNDNKLRQHLIRKCVEIDEDIKKSIVSEVESENRFRFNEIIIEDFDHNMKTNNNKIFTKIVVKNSPKVKDKRINKQDINVDVFRSDSKRIVFQTDSSKVKTLKKQNSNLNSKLKTCLQQNEALIQINKYLDKSLDLMQKLDSIKDSLKYGSEERVELLRGQLDASNDSAKEWKQKYHLIEYNDKMVKIAPKKRPKKESSIWQYFKRIPNKTTADGCQVIKCIYCRKIFRQIHLNAYKCRQHIVEFCDNCPEDIKEKENQWVEYKPRSKVDIWQHFKVTEEDNKTCAECLYCGFNYSYKNATKFRQHLVFKCIAIPYDIKEDIKSQCDEKFLEAFEGQNEKTKISFIFDHFEVTEEDDGKTQCKCNYCGQTYAYKNATKFRQHLIDRCNGIPGDVRQEVADISAETSKTWTQTNIDVWKYFHISEEDGKTNCQCIYCGHTFAYKNATKSREHLIMRCNDIPESVKEKILVKCKNTYLNNKQNNSSVKIKKERKIYVRREDGHRGGRRKCHVWQYFNEELDSQSNTRRRCMYCNHMFGVGTSRNATKLKEHLGLYCKSIPEDIKQFVIEMNDSSLRTYKKRELQPLRWHECEWPGCDMKFPKKARLLSHQMIHTGVIRIKCDWPGCEWTGRSRYAVNVHKHSHTGEKPYVCDWPGCDFRTANTASLCVHKMRHKNLLRYKCDWPQCERTFLTSSQRNVHKMVHLGIKPYPCQFCDKRYPQLNKLKTHQNKQHSNQKELFDYQSFNKRT